MARKGRQALLRAVDGRTWRPVRLLGVLLSTSLVATGVILVLAPARPAFAANILSDLPLYGPNAVITVTGQTDYVTNCPAGGINDVFGVSSAAVFIVPEITAEGIKDGSKLTDVQPVAHVVIDDPTAGFLNEPVGFTQPAGHVGPGTYAFVVDECQDQTFHAGIDDVFLNAFTVAFPSGTGSLPKIDSTIAQIKAAAKVQAMRSLKVLGSLSLLFELEQTVPGDFGNTLIGQIEGLVSVLTGVSPRANILTLEGNEVVHYASVAADPPDPNFASVAPLQISPPLLPTESDPLGRAATALANQANVDSGTVEAVLNAMQRYEGAQQANDLQAALNQAVALEGYGSDLAAQLPKTNIALNTLSTQIGALPASFDTQSAQLAQIQQQVKADGLTSDQTNELNALGIAPATVNQAITNLEAAPAGATRAQLQATIGQLIADNNQAITAYQVLATDPVNGLPPLIGALQTEEHNANVLAANAQSGSSSPTPISLAQPGPTAIAGGPYSGTVGTPITFDGSASTAAPGTTISSYAWDDDGTGNFTSAAGAKPSITVNQPFDGFVGLKVVASNGRSALAYTRLTVTTSAAQPVITAFAPATNPRLAPNGSQAFSVTATPANATYQWSVDGANVPSATGSGFTYQAPGATGFHPVKVVVNGSDPNGGADTKIWDVNVLAPPGALNHLDLTPSTASVAAGSPQAYRAEGWASTAGGDLGDVTSATAFSIIPDGSCTGAICTATKAGAHVVTGRDGGATGTANLTVTGGALDHLALTPASSSIAAGGTRGYAAEGFDAAGNDLGDVTSATTFSIAPDGSCTGATCTATTGGAHIVTGTDGTATGTANLTVTGGALDHLALTPASSSIAAGGTRGYAAEGFDAAGNDLGDVTSATTFSITPDGSCTGAICTATKAGAHVVTGRDGSAKGTANLTVTGGPVARLVLNPASAAITSGGVQGYFAEGFDAAGNDVGDVTGVTAFSITPDGSCTGAACTARARGVHTLTGTDGTAQGTALLGVNTAGPDPAGTIYVADFGAGRIDVFPAGSNGNVAPIRSISGPLSGVSRPGDVTVDPAGDVYSSNYGTSSITEYGPGASGNVAPIRTIAGPNTGLNNPDDLSLAPDGTLYVGNYTGGNILVFAPGASGNAAPERMITTLSGPGADTDGVGVDATGTLYANDSIHATINAFAPGANGAAPPVRVISGAATGVAFPDDVKVDFSGNLVVSDVFGSVLTFAPGANGNVAPTRRITGSNTGLPRGNTDDLAVDATGAIYVTTFAGQSLVEFGPGANGNVAPVATIAGSATTFSEPEGVAVATEPPPALTTSASASSVGLGSATQDTASLAGNGPSGSLIFKLFGPNDATCSSAPAFISPVVAVAGNGTYPSSPFTPGALGTYRWVALYSGDSRNAPASTACQDPAETVTVVKAPNPATTLTYTGPASGDHSDSVTLSATLTTTSVSSAPTVFAGYADIRDANFPNPWVGAAGVVCVCDTSQAAAADPDESAIRIDNPTSAAIAIAAVKVTCGGGNTIDMWGSPSIPAGQSIILTSTAGDNFDGSDSCAQPDTVTVTYNGVATTYRDAAHAIPGGPISANETIAWSPLGPIPGLGGTVGGPLPGEKLNLTLGSHSCVTGPTDLNGVGSCTVTITDSPGPLPAGATFAGDSLHSASTAPAVPFTVSPEETVAVATGATSGDFNDPVTLSGTLTDGETPAVAIVGKSLVLSMGTQSCSGTTDTTGRATCSLVVKQPSGVVDAAATFTADSDNRGTTSPVTSFTITKEQATVAYRGATSITGGTSVTLSGLLRADSMTAIVARTVTFTLGSGPSAQTCSGTTDANGSASCSLTVTQPPGPTSIVAAFAGDDFYLPAAVSTPVSVDNPTVLTIGPATTGDFDDPVAVSATLVDGGGHAVPNAAVTLVLNGAEHCQATTGATGQASCSLTPLEAAGTYRLTATFSGDARHLGSTTSHSFVVTREPTALTYRGPTLIGRGSSVTVSAMLASDGAALASRTVTFAVGAGPSAQVCQAATDATGTAQCRIADISQAPGVTAGCGSSTNDLSASTSCTALAVKATFAGDPYYGPSSAAPAAILATIACTATITGSVPGAVVVTQGTSCIDQATVGGAVLVSPGAAVVVVDSVIHGGVVSNRATALTVCHSTVSGSVTVYDTVGFVLIGAGSDASLPCAGNVLSGSVVISKSGPNGNDGGIELSGNTVGVGVQGSVTVNGNTAPSGGRPTENNATEIEGNTINGAISCANNTPPPTNDGSPNTVFGASNGQCAGI